MAAPLDQLALRLRAGAEPRSLASEPLSSGAAFPASKYAYLSLHPTQTRLLRLLPGQLDDPLRGCLVHAELYPPDQVPNYEALSYAWGSQLGLITCHCRLERHAIRTRPWSGLFRPEPRCGLNTPPPCRSTQDTVVQLDLCQPARSARAVHSSCSDGRRLSACLSRYRRGGVVVQVTCQHPLMTTEALRCSHRRDSSRLTYPSILNRG